MAESKNSSAATSTPIEDYALLSDGHRAALVDRRGSIDWLCLPRFDSPACFTALLGREEHGRWQIAPVEEFTSERRYSENSLVLETDFRTAEGEARLTDFLAVQDAPTPLLLREVRGLRGRLRLKFRLVLRFDYGSIVPWVRKKTYGLHAVAGPDEVHVQAPWPLNPDADQGVTVEFDLEEGQSLWFSLTWNPYFRSDFQPWPDVANQGEKHRQATDKYWRDFAGRCIYRGRYPEAVLRSVLTLKALIYKPTGGIVAAPTTSLPETLGGERNWDYRFCWIRDSTFSMYALLTAGYHDEARAWRDWLLRALAGTPSQVNIMYGLAGRRRLTEMDLGWLEGYEGSKPVREGNAAYQQLQLDVFGEALDTLYLALKSGLPPDENSWRVQTCFIEFLANNWNQPDEGIWEMRGPRQHFTHSKVMAWVAVDRAIKSAEQHGLKAPRAEWIALRDEIHADVCRRGFSPEKNSFTQVYGSENVDASLLMIPMVGFLPPEDPRVQGTIAAVERELFADGFVLRYKTDEVRDVLHGREGSFLACSFWLADCWILSGRLSEAEALFQRLVGLANDVLLLSEEYDAPAGRLVGNFPQALSHIALINTAFNLQTARGPAHDRSQT